MDYYTSKNPSTTIEKAILITEGKPIRAIETLFSYELGMKVNKLEELNRVIADPSLNMSVTELTVYLSNVGCILNPVNFVPRSALIKAKKGSDSRSTIFVLAGAFVIALAVVLVPLIQYLSKNSESKQLKSDIKRIEDITVVVDKYHTAKDKYDDVNAFMLYASDPDDDILKFINFLEEEMPSDISITNLSIASGEVTMVCKGSSKDTVAAFIVTLKNQSNISSVVCNTITESVDENDVATVTYTITCNFAKFPEKAAN
jgi:type IV pilus assembly protein PilM